MSTADRTASTSDARKRKLEDPEYAEKFVGRINEVMFPRDAERATELLDRVSGRLKEALGGHLPDEVREALSILDLHLPPPPAPVPVWSVLSTDREKPTLAKVTFDDGAEFGRMSFAGLWFFNEATGKINRDGDRPTSGWAMEHVVSIEEIPTYDPSTHVPVERALIDEAARTVADPVAGRWAMGIVRALAALADGNQS